MNDVTKIYCYDYINAEKQAKAAKIRSCPGICAECGEHVESRDAACICNRCRSKRSKFDRKMDEAGGKCKR